MVYFGFTDLDRLLSGWQKSRYDCWRLVPRNEGKTSFRTFDVARNSSRTIWTSSLLSFLWRCQAFNWWKLSLAMETGISSEKIRKGFSNAEDWHKLNTV
ncbi:MAG: hypothetical protein IPO32_19800 [Crocinitomicaceae bacterium]|nr:hypothetical protein [Crocinitomicaceae bacterium]